MGNIVDMSKFQKSSDINWPVFSKNADMLIIRVQYGSLEPDSEYLNHVANAKKYGIPFYTYAFPEFISVVDSRVEADNAVNREGAASLGMIIDIEAEYNSKGQPAGINKLPYSERLEGIRVYVDELQKKGVGRIGAYIEESIYKSWGIDTIIGIFDFVWIAYYGPNNGQPNQKPPYPCDLWQYTSKGRVPGYNGDLDLSALCGSKTLQWFIEKNAMTKPEDLQ